MLSAKSRIAARLMVVATLAALTAGCFQPMYAERGDGKPGLREKLQGVEVPPLDYPNASPQARVGVNIRNALMFKMYGSAVLGSTINEEAPVEKRITRRWVGGMPVAWP